MKKGTRRIWLTQGKYTVVDSVDYRFLSRWKWFAAKHPTTHGYRWYAVRTYRHRLVLMHRVVAKRAGLPFCQRYDHRDRVGLNNTRTNIRPCTNGQNMANGTKKAGCSSGYKGVHWHKASKKWQATITVNYKHIYLGLFDTEQEAHQAYVFAALKFFGEFAYAG